jgi:hypothetical protein
MNKLGSAVLLLGFAAAGCAGDSQPAEQGDPLYRRCSTRDVTPGEANEVDNKVEAVAPGA